jgi:hypothetical protein
MGSVIKAFYYACMPVIESGKRWTPAQWRDLRRVAPGWDETFDTLKKAQKNATQLSRRTGIKFYAFEYEEI